MVAMRPMKILFAGGGTGGHLYPALRLAEGIREYAEARNMAPPEIAFLGNPDGLEGRILPGRERFYPLPVQGFHRGGILIMVRRNLGFFGKLIQSYRQSLRIFAVEQPDIVVGTGGYVSGAPLFAAALHGIPTLIQEQNSYPGVTTRILSWMVDSIHVAYQNASALLPKKKRSN